MPRGVTWFTNMLVTVFITMLFIYIIKWGAEKWQIPFVKEVAAEV